jgi:hypothetical protein
MYTTRYTEKGATPMTNVSPIQTEGPVAKSIEQHTAKIPSDWFLWAAVGSMATSLMLQINRRDHASQFVGQWAPTLLILGLYNKLVKQLGSDRQARAAA